MEFKVKYNHGMIIGKFMPLHVGHVELITNALECCDRITIVLVANDTHPIPGKKRLEWLNQTFFEYDNMEIFILNKEDSMDICADDFADLIPSADVLIGGEDYVGEIAKGLLMDFIMVMVKDHYIRGSEILKDPYLHWDSITPLARPYFVNKIAILCADLSIKQKFTNKLCDLFRTRCSSESALLTVSKMRTSEIISDTYLKNAKLQNIFDMMQLKDANKIMFCEGDAITTQVYHMERFDGKRNPELEQLIADTQDHSLYLVITKKDKYIEDPILGTTIDSSGRHYAILKELNMRAENYFIVGEDDWYPTAVTIIKNTYKSLKAYDTRGTEVC